MYHAFKRLPEMALFRRPLDFADAADRMDFVRHGRRPTDRVSVIGDEGERQQRALWGQRRALREELRAALAWGTLSAQFDREGNLHAVPASYWSRLGLTRTVALEQGCLLFEADDPQDWFGFVNCRAWLDGEAFERWLQAATPPPTRRGRPPHACKGRMKDTLHRFLDDEPVQADGTDWPQECLFEAMRAALTPGEPEPERTTLQNYLSEVRSERAATV